MHRMGHASMRAALVYQHSTSGRDREIAEAMDKRISKHQGKKSGSRRHRGEPPEDGGATPARAG
jgi:hypothetical protein